MHKVHNKLLMIIGCVSYTGAFLLLALLDITIPQWASYWAMIFPSLILMVIGADLHFNVANVSFPLRSRFSLSTSLTSNNVDVRYVLTAKAPTIRCGRHLQHRRQAGLDHGPWHHYCHL